MLLPDNVTPHTLRRTFASLALAAGRDPRWVMAQLGHADARLTLSVYAPLNVYAQVMQRQRIDEALVWQLMRFPAEPGGAVVWPNEWPNGPVSSSRNPVRVSAHRASIRATRTQFRCRALRGLSGHRSASGHLLARSANRARRAADHAVSFSSCSVATSRLVSVPASRAASKAAVPRAC